MAGSKLPQKGEKLVESAAVEAFTDRQALGLNSITAKRQGSNAQQLSEQGWGVTESRVGE